ncbi:MAG: hypothetical protein K6B69_07175, partial [Lachnospiraceae bacterium]|nr:hypothetical protein [Lachnospiraceae bacterium]
RDRLDVAVGFCYSGGNGICGITQSELTERFAPEIDELALTEKMNREDCLAKLKKCMTAIILARIRMEYTIPSVC